MTAVVLIIYFGEIWPPWFMHFLRSCERNSFLHWKIFTNISPCEAPNNVEFIPFSAEEFKTLAEEKLGIKPTFTDPYKVCDFRITFGKLFEDHLKGYDYWGHGDIDLVYGNLEKFIAPLFPYQYDVISLAYNRLTGHLGFLRNTPAIVNSYKKLDNWKETLEASDMKWISEYPFSKVFNKRRSFFQDLDPFDRWIYRKNSDFIFTEGLWENGDLYVINGDYRVEVPIYHFYIYLSRYREQSWKVFNKIVHVSYEAPKWRITDIGISPSK